MTNGGIVKGAGRQAVSDVRDFDWELFVKNVHDLPNVVARDGFTKAWVYADTQLRSLMDAMSLFPHSTPDDVARNRTAHALLTEGTFAAMAPVPDDNAAVRCRGAFLRAVERLLVHPTMRAAFDRSTTLPEGYKPVVEEREAE